jgi:colanic acid/amylovoran biosynthesis glycosyltransferase
MRLAYLVSRFPVATETFILRELVAVQAALGAPVDLYSLLPPAQPFAHPAAVPFVARLQEAGWKDGVRGLAWALGRRPRALARVLAAIVRDYGRDPGRLVRALVTVPLAAGHARRLQAAGVDHVHAHWANVPTLAAWTIKQLTGIPYSFTPHAHDIFVHQSHLARLIDDASFVSTISDYNRAFLRAYGDGSTPVHVVRYAIEVERFRLRQRRVPAAGPVRALCVASFTAYKGHHVLFAALALGGGQLDRVQLDLVGRGPLEDELRALAQRLGLTDRITWHGTLTEEQVRERFAAADLFVLPSIVAANGDQEGLPNVLLEALAAGCPAIGTATAGAPELLREEATCLLAMPGDTASLAAAIEHVLVEPDDAARRAEHGRRLVEAHYTAERAGREMAALLLDAPAPDRSPNPDPGRTVGEN